MKARFDADLVIVGSGLAATIAALRASDLGLSVAIVSKGEGASSWAQGGIVFPSKINKESFIDDVLQAGCAVNNRAALELLAEEGSELVENWLIGRFGVPFDKTSEGKFHRTLEAAHSEARIIHVADSTGRGLMRPLEIALKAKAGVLHYAGSLVDLLITSRHDSRQSQSYAAERVCGVYYLDSQTNEVKTLVARAVLIASGGFSQIYKHATGPSYLRGEGIAAAHRAGARSMNLEYVQFHPTALFIPGQARKLLTEALRGAGAKLLNMNSKSFVDELAPRDVVARSIHQEILKNGPGGHVFLDCRKVDMAQFPAMTALLREYSLDPESDLIPVVPAAHYTIGGIWTDLDGKTSSPGLWAAGEVACTGVHGANRLASTSLLEALVFGYRAADSIFKESQNLELDFVPRSWKSESAPVDEDLLTQDFQFLRNTMWNYVGLLRSEKRLKRAEKSLLELRSEIESFYSRGRLSDALLSLRHSVLVANLVLYSALRNKKSLGTHYLMNEE